MIEDGACLTFLVRRPNEWVYNILHRHFIMKEILQMIRNGIVRMLQEQLVAVSAESTEFALSFPHYARHPTTHPRLIKYFKQ